MVFAQPSCAAMPVLESRTVTVEGLVLHYLESGLESGLEAGEASAGPPVLMLHGWPTHAELYRYALPLVGASRRAIALDLPGFGQSAKPLDASYSFRFYDRIISGFLDALGIDELALVVHDLGGPIGLHWLAGQRERVRELVLLNTIVFPEMSWMVYAFVLSARIPGIRSLLASPWGPRAAMRLGIRDPERHGPEVLDRYVAPFADKRAREALLRTAYGLHPKGFKTVAESVRGLEIPVRLLYGERDRILPHVAKTMARVHALVPHAELSSIPDCGHFLQEDRPDEVAQALADFFAQ